MKVTKYREKSLLAIKDDLIETKADEMMFLNAFLK